MNQKEILGLKSLITTMKMHQIHRRFEQAGKQEKSELEDRLIEIIQADKQEKKILRNLQKQS